MAHVSVHISIDKIDAIGLENFDFHVDAEYSSEEILAVMAALPQYMGDLIKLVEASGKE